MGSGEEEGVLSVLDCFTAWRWPCFQHPSHRPCNHTLQILQVACGGMHTVVLTEDGQVYSWGVNDEGALGRPTGELGMIMLL